MAKKGMQMLSIIIMCAQLRIRIADLAVTVHICMVPHTCRETIFLAGNPVSMETSNYLTQKNNTGAGGMLTQSELSFSTFMWLLNNCMFCMSLNYTGCIRKTKKRQRSSLHCIRNDSGTQDLYLKSVSFNRTTSHCGSSLTHLFPPDCVMLLSCLKTPILQGRRKLGQIYIM